MMKTKLIIGVGLVAILAALAFFWKTDDEVSAASQKTFVLDVDLDKFRQILVRADATASIVEHCGMKLTRESVQSLDINLKNDRRPILNAIIGKSKAEVTACKSLTVELSDPILDTHELDLRQDSQIQPNKIHVRTESTRPAGKLRSYRTTLDAVRETDKTSVTLTVDMSIDLHISPFFTQYARSRVQDAAEHALDEQEAAIRDLVSRFSNSSLVLRTMHGAMQ
jgi:hypothetical protein